MEYDALVQHYQSSIAAVELDEKLLATKLFQEVMTSIRRNRKTPASALIDRISTRLEHYVSRLTNTVALLSGASSPVPNTMHFVWVGGSEVGVNQRDYMNIWREVLKPQDYTFNLWYDSDALLAFEMNRVILDSARVHAMESGGDQVTKPSALAQMIEDRARVLKHQMFAYLNQPQWAGRADEARIDLMVRAYGKDRATLEAFRQKCLDTHLNMVGPDLRLRDARHEFAGHFLQDVYQREVAMRGNFAAASDVVRLQAEYLEGGRYSDMDYLPPLAEKLGGVDIRGFHPNERLWVLKQLLDHNPGLMPGRDPLRYKNETGSIPEGHAEALTAFARSKPALHDIFVAPPASRVPQDAIRLGTAYSDPSRGEMNAHMLAHPGAGMTRSIMEVIRFNYDCLNEVERRMVAAGADWGDVRRLGEVIDTVLNERGAQGITLSHADMRYMGFLDVAIRQYYSDGIRPEARGTIVLTGPSAASAGVGKYTETHLLLDQWEAVRKELKLTEGFNLSTEEENITGWTVNGDPEQWLAKEQEKWQTGKLKSRYVGSVGDLLKGQTLTFKQGWPVIEGKPVLLTAVLQQLMDDLGEPFIRAMKDKLSGDISFDKAFSIGFDSRQQILAQTFSELPVSLGAESTSNLNELFTRVAHGSLAVEHLSPLLRVMLGGVFGATSLDAEGFARVWQEVSNIARDTTEAGVFARYRAIETALHQRQAPVLATGVARLAQPDTHTAQELKVLALNEALTLTQWRERIGQINSTAQREYHTQILQRSGQVRDVFFKAGAVSARQMPQDLLMRRDGDPGRRCYPLALLMASALGLGESAERALIGRVANAGLSPDDAESRALLLALDELHEVATSEVGTPQGMHGLDSIVQTLEAKTAPAILLLNTGDHALLLAKVLLRGEVVYRFYDPNFAIFGFAGVREMQLGMERYLSAGDGAMARLYGLGELATAQFKVTELNAERIANKVLSSNVQVGRFLQNGVIADAQGVSVWERQAVGRTRSLGENSRMGASLAQLDARYWAQALDQATVRLRNEYKLGREYLPLLETVEKTPGAGYSLTLVDAHQPKNALKVITADVRFSKIKQHLQRLVKTLAGRDSGANEADGGSRLSFAFAIQTLITEMRHRDYLAGDAQVPSLSIALQVQVYVNYAQLGYGVLSDAAQIVSLVRQVAASEQALALRQSSLSGRLLGRASTVAGFGFSLVNIGFDIYGLSVAQNQEQRSRLATQLAFDVAALGLDVFALAAGGTAGAAASFLAVPLLGIGIGATAIASNLGQISDKAQAVGAHLRKIQDAYGQGAYTRKDGVLSFEPEAVITHLDLRSNQIRFDSQRFYPMVRGGLELPQIDPRPQRLDRAINIREALELPQVIGLIRPVPDELHTVVLPCTPACFYAYEYQVGTAGFPYQPGAGELQREPLTSSEISSPDLLSIISPGVLIQNLLNPSIETQYPHLRNSAVDKLEFDKQGNRRFYFFANTPIPHILYKLTPVCQPTTIVVTLDALVRQLVVPQLPPEWHTFLSYEITARSTGVSQLWLTPGLVAVSLKVAGPGQWAVNAPWVKDTQIRYEGDSLLIDGIRLDGRVDFLSLAGGELFQVDRLRKRLSLLSITVEDNSVLPGKGTLGVNLEDRGSLPKALARIRQLAKAQRLAAAYLALYKFKVPFTPAAQPVFTTAYFDTANDRVLYARDLPEAVNEGLLLGGVSGQHAWFYHPDHPTIWRVDTVTGTVNHRYRLMNADGGSTISGVEQSADGQLRVTQHIGKRTTFGANMTMDYVIAAQTLTLVCINTWETWRHDRLFANDEEDWSLWIERLQPEQVFDDGTPAMAASISPWKPTPFINGRVHLFSEFQYSVWIRLHDNAFFRDDSGSAERTLLMWDQPDASSQLFFDKRLTALIRSAGDPNDPGGFVDEMLETDVVDVVSLGSRYIVTRSDGRLFEVGSDASLKFVGVGQRWLTRHPDWLVALPALMKTRQEAPFPIIGLRNVSGSGLLAAWCVGERLLLADIGHGKELSLLGLTPDQQAAWLLDVSAGQLYRQTLIRIDALHSAFVGAQLRHPERLPVAQKVWAQWTFAEVTAQGQGLLGRSREGVNLQLLDQQPGLILGVKNQWSHRPGQNSAQLRIRLKILLQGQRHAPVLTVENVGNRHTYYVPQLDRLFDVAGRSDGQWAVFLGTRNESVAMLFDPTDDLIFSRGATPEMWIGNSYAQREKEVMTLEMNGVVGDVMALLPDGVDKLVLTFGAQASTYRISEAAWQRLDCIVLDTRQPEGAAESVIGTLVLDMADCRRLLVSLVDGHLLFSDPDNAHTLIVRDVKSEDGKPGAPVQISINVDGQHIRTLVEHWLNALEQTRGNNEVATLAALLNDSV
ncbi:TcdA/TcdB pore-forming domain-containing protein [Pseudomonas sp. NPDC087598]|uniref:TcdA/TcdB pore-forming domain-containing protein n=1 Tax=Pseudomonas sp. NPDC087598 TaxID=3364440 RepID=UPI0037FC614E